MNETKRLYAGMDLLTLKDLALHLIAYGRVWISGDEDGNLGWQIIDPKTIVEMCEALDKIEDTGGDDASD